MSSAYRDLFVSAKDGLRLYARDYGPDTGDALAVVCLPGLARHSADFHELACALSQDTSRPRRVLTLDYRGRGRSDWDADWRKYNVQVELEDTLQVLAVAGIERAIFIGTSRGGLITMGLSATRPTLLAGAVLNDVGPIIEAKGLIRIRGYLGKLPSPASFMEGAEILKRMSYAQFPHLTDEHWDKQARATWRETQGRLALAYDPNLMKTLEALDPEMKLPDLWSLFEGLRSVPVLAIRGSHSDLLAPETLGVMKERHPRLEAITVPDQGHAPILNGGLVQAISHFVKQVEASI